MGEVIPRLTRTSVLAHNVILGTVETANSKTAKRLVSAEAMSFLEQSEYTFFSTSRGDLDLLLTHDLQTDPAFFSLRW